MRIAVRSALVGLAAAGLAAPALAHHSFAMFDFQANKVLTGTVVQFDWTNPHTFLWLDVPAGPGGVVEKWGIEGMSPNYLGRRGWSKTTLKPGDKVTVTIHPLKDGAKGGTMLKVVLPDGKQMTNLGGA